MLLNLSETEDSKVYFISDLHLRHDPKWPVPLWEGRGFTSVQSHDEAIIDTINATVRPNDKLMFLGDFCLNTKIEQFEDFIDRIKCQTIFFLWGNHNNPHEKQIYKPLVKEWLKGQIYSISGVTLDIEVYPFRYKNVVYMGHYLEMIVNGQYIILSHFPYAIWNEVKRGAWMLCGHSHYNFPTTQAECSEGKILDVGWDGHGKPWSLQEIADVMNTKQIVKVDHH